MHFFRKLKYKDNPRLRRTLGSWNDVDFFSEKHSPTTQSYSCYRSNKFDNIERTNSSTDGDVRSFQIIRTYKMYERTLLTSVTSNSNGSKPYMHLIHFIVKFEENTVEP